MSTLSTKNIASAIYETTKGKSGSELEKSLLNAKDFLVKKNLISKSTAILKELQRLIDKDSGVVRAKILSADHISENTSRELKALLKTRYKANEITLDLREDLTLLKGMRIETEDEVIDLSTKSKLNQLKTALLQN